MIRVCVAGASGRLGTPVSAGIETAGDLELVARVGRTAGDGVYPSVREALAATQVDVVADLSVAEAADDAILAAIEAGVPFVLGATGIASRAARSARWGGATVGVPLFFVPNFALGAVVMMALATRVARHLPHAEVIEEHADTKRDRPSGTALRTADLIEATAGRRPPIHSLRLPGLVANQSVVFGATGQTLELRHVTTSREAFVPGALLAIRRVGGLRPGLTVGLDHLLDLS